MSRFMYVDMVHLAQTLEIQFYYIHMGMHLWPTQIQD